MKLILVALALATLAGCAGQEYAEESPYSGKPSAS